MTTYTTSTDEAVALILAHCTPNLRLATPLGLGKPYCLLNALYDAVANDPSRHLSIYTALSVNPPHGGSELEKRFLTPFVNRLYGKDFARLKYADAVAKDALPANIEVQEFYMQSGAMLGSQTAQSGYASLNYTHVPEALASRDLNVIVQKLAQDAGGNYSLSCNTDLTLDTLDAIVAQGRPKPFFVGVVDSQLPFIGGEAEVKPQLFDVIVTPKADMLHSKDSDGKDVDGKDAKLFALPRQPVDDVDYAIGLYASTLIKDGGTLQIGIGALADALCHALVLRHTDNATYKKVLNALDPNLAQHPSVNAYGGLEPFEIGLYGCSEMLNEGFRLLVQHGIVKRRVVEDQALMQRVANGKATEADAQILQNEGQFLHGAFYLGSPDFYDWLRQLEGTKNTVGMRRISQINSVVGEHYLLEKYKRQHARFFNTCMMATTLGGAASETLPDGRVVSGVGGQYNFVSMGHSLPEAKSVLMLRSTRTSKGEVGSNILWSVANLTIPRHLRDVYITEYGIADLRYASDSECIQAMLNIADSRFGEALLQQAIDSKKMNLPILSKQQKSNVVDGEPDSNSFLANVLAKNKQNTLEKLANSLRPFRQNGTLPSYPLGSDFTDTEQDVVRALAWLKANTQTKPAKLNAVFDVFVQNVSDKFNDLIGFNDETDNDDFDNMDTRIQAAMQRMGYMNESGEEVDDGLNSELFEHALRQTLQGSTKD